MSSNVYAISKIVGTSEKSVEDAINNALVTAGKPLRNMEWFDVSSTRGHIVDGRVGHYQVTLEIGFRYDKPS